MSFQAVLEEVVKDSIRSAICIDDRYAPAYYRKDDLIFDEPAQLYNSFRDVGQCDLDIYQFKNIEESWRKDYMLLNKDLMILDWELDAGGGFESAVTILADVIESQRIPFVLIYTNHRDLNAIGKTLIGRFNPITEDVRESLYVELDKSFGFISDDKDSIDSEIFFDQTRDRFFEYFFHYRERPRIHEELITAFAESFKIKTEHRDNIAKKINAVINSRIGITGDAILDLSLFVLNEDSSGKCYDISRIEIEGHAYKIDGTIILLYHKETENAGIEPRNLFSEFAKTVVNNPHNYLTILSLEFKDKLREDFSSIGLKFSQIDDKAFFYHLNNYRTEDGSAFDLKYIYDFILKNWIGDLHCQRLNASSKVLEFLDERYQAIKDNVPSKVTKEDSEFLKELVRYSSFISCIYLQVREDCTLRFGDIFVNEEKGDEFFICITPLCDCVRSDEKIKNNFYFVRGIDDHDDYTALENAESDYYSFLDFSGRTCSVRWICKPFTAHITSNDINKLNLSYCGNDLKVKHVARLKENFTQRIANQSFGYGYRVGIDLPHLNEPEKS